MQISKVSEHNGWKIYTFSHEDKAEGWLPGDPLRHHAWGSAEESRVWSPNRHRKPTEILKVFPTYFGDCDRAHESIRHELIRQIARFKKSAEAVEQQSPAIAGHAGR